MDPSSWMTKITGGGDPGADGRVAEVELDRDRWKSRYEQLREDSGAVAALRERDDLLEAMHVELSLTKKNLRDVTSEADANIRKSKDQLRDAKARAKELIQNETTRAAAAREALNATLAEREQQLEELRRALARKGDEIAEAQELRSQVSELSARCTSSQQTVDSLKQKIADMSAQETGLSAQGDGLSVKKRIAELESALSERASEEEHVKAERDRLQNRLRESEAALQSMRSGSLADNDSFTSVERHWQDLFRKLQSGDTALDLDAEKISVMSRLQKLEVHHNGMTADLKAKLCAAETEMRDARSSLEQRVQADGTNSGQLADLQNQLAEALRVRQDLESQLNTAEDQSTASDSGTVSDLTARLRDARMSQDHAQKELAAIRQELEQARRRLDVAADHLSGARAELERERKQRQNLERQAASAVNPATDNEIRSKVADLEGQLAAKTAELTKTRDKAKTYLKEINAEKTRLQERLEKETSDLTEQLSLAQTQRSDASERAAAVSKELEGAMNVIFERQQSVQALEMRVAAGRREIDAVQGQLMTCKRDFDMYKDKARKALAERDASIAVVDRAVADATSQLQEELRMTQLDLGRARKENARIAELETQIRAYEEKLKEAPQGRTTARDDLLLPSHVDTRVLELEDKVAGIEGELTAALSRASDAEARCAAATVKVEVLGKGNSSLLTQRAQLELKHAEELASKNAEILRLVDDMKKASASTKAAQRTAAAAAMAFDFSSSPGALSKPGSMTTLTSPGPVRSSSSVSDFRLPTAALSEELQEESTLLRNELTHVRESLLDAQNMSDMREEQIRVLKKELRELESRHQAAQKLRDGLPYEYLKNTFVRFLETDDLETMLPVFSTVLSFTPEEIERIRDRRGAAAAQNRGNSSVFGLFGR